MKKKVCIVTAARSEYGLLRWIIDSVYKDAELELQLVVTGGHLSEEQGLTYKNIEEDGYPIVEKISMLQSCVDENDIAKAMGRCALSMVDTFDRLRPDIVVVLGDRYELLPIVSTALVMRIPIAHIAGGDITEGAIDDEIRNAVTMMSTLHFPGVEDAAENIKRMRNSDKDIFVVGETGLENIQRFDLWSKEKIASELGLDLNKKWCLVTLHPETKLSVKDNMDMANQLYETMCLYPKLQYVITKANTDLGGAQINKFWENVVPKQDNMCLIASLGQMRYLSFMKYADLVLGNSSSGIVEAPFMGIPVVNIGDRQTGRHICKTVVCCGRTENEIKSAMDVCLTMPHSIDTYWGDGKTSEKIISHLKTYLNE